MFLLLQKKREKQIWIAQFKSAYLNLILHSLLFVACNEPLHKMQQIATEGLRQKHNKDQQKERKHYD